jgi:fructose-specific component phosphotransferase system IIB-like protein
MNLELIDSTLRRAYSKNGREMLQVRNARTPLSELIAKDSLPDLDEMTEHQLCEFAAEHHIAIDQGLTRLELIDVIKQSAQANWHERVKTLNTLLDFIFQDGPHPSDVVKRLYALAKRARPQCVANMSLADLAILCGEEAKGDRKTNGRATQSARLKRLFEKPIKDAKMKGFKAPYQKGASASPAYSESAKGNQNRRGSAFLREQQRVRERQQHEKKAA